MTSYHRQWISFLNGTDLDFQMSDKLDFEFFVKEKTESYIRSIYINLMRESFDAMLSSEFNNADYNCEQLKVLITKMIKESLDSL